MAAILIVGPDGPAHSQLRQVLVRAGYRVLDADERMAALRVLGGDREHLVGILLATLPQAEASELLGAVMTDDRLCCGRTFLLLATDPLYLPASLARLCDKLAVPVLAQPRGEQDQGAWDDVLDAVALAMRHFPDDPSVAAHADLAPGILPSGNVELMPRATEASDIARQLAVGMVVFDNGGKLVGQVTACDWTHQVLVVMPHPFAQHNLSVPFACVATVEPESMTIHLAQADESVRGKFASLPPE